MLNNKRFDKKVNDEVKQFHNGNISIKFNKETIDVCNNNEHKYLKALEEISYIINNIDCYYIGDEYSCGNYDVGISIYNVNTGLIYRFVITYCVNELLDGKTLKLYGSLPDEDDLTMIKEEFD